MSGMPLRGSVVEEPPEKVEAQGSLSPGTNTNVVAAVRAGKSARREASWSKYSIVVALMREMIKCAGYGGGGVKTFICDAASTRAHRHPRKIPEQPHDHRRLLLIHL